MTNPDDLDQRWRDIAEQLGLEPEATRASQPRAEEQTEAPPLRKQVVNERPGAEGPADESWLESPGPAPDENFPDPLGNLQKVEFAGESITDAVEREGSADVFGPAQETPTGKDALRGGRSRRRRRRQTKSAKETAANAPDQEEAVKGRERIESRVEESTPETDREEASRQGA